MVITLKRLLEWLILLWVFILLALLLYQIVFFLNQWISNSVKPEEPIGNSIKVVGDSFENGYGYVFDNKMQSPEIIERLRLFYLLGE